MPPSPKQRLHDLVEQLSDEHLEPAQRYLISLCSDEDPVMCTMRATPVDDQELTDEDRQAIAEGYQDIAAGRVMPDHEVRRKLGP